MQSLELEALFKKYIPNFESGIEGATEDEILELERLSVCKVPEFYRWFLLRMGRDMGELSFPTIDFTLTKLIKCYRDGLVKPDPRYLLIGYESKEGFSNIYYDLSGENNDDAIVLRRDPDNDENDLSFETFLELLAWTIVYNKDVDICPDVCKGVFIDDDGSDDAGDVLLKLDPVMKGFDFDFPIKTGKYRGIYIGNVTTLITNCPPNDDCGYHGFFLSGTDKDELRRVLYEIESVADLEIEVDENDPRRLDHDD